MKYHRQNNEPYGVEITDILESDERIIQVVLKDTDKAAIIRQDQVIDVVPGIIFIPFWLAKRILDMGG